MVQIVTIILVSLLLLGGYGCQIGEPKPKMVERDQYIRLEADAAAAETLYLKCNKEADRLERENKQLKHILDSHYEDFNRERGME